MELIVFITGAAGYTALEYAFRGYTHWSMALTGGACLLVFYYYARENEGAPIVAKAAVGACIFTVFEFFVGMVVNLWYHWDVWDYSNEPGNIMGQICPMFSFAWFIICLSLLILSSSLRYLYMTLRHERCRGSLEGGSPRRP